MIQYSVYEASNKLMSEGESKWYARCQTRGTLKEREFCKRVAELSGIATQGTVTGVMVEIGDVLVHELLNGNSVQFGELGTFSLTLHSDGARTPADFSNRNIRSVNITFTPSERYKNLADRAEFQQVPSRVMQAMTLKAEKKDFFEEWPLPKLGASAKP